MFLELEKLTSYPYQTALQYDLYTFIYGARDLRRRRQGVSHMSPRSVATTPRSLCYRRLASAAAELASQEPDHEKMLDKLREAMSWIAAAENEEVMVVADRDPC